MAQPFQRRPNPLRDALRRLAADAAQAERQAERALRPEWNGEEFALRSKSQNAVLELCEHNAEYLRCPKCL